MKRILLITVILLILTGCANPSSETLKCIKTEENTDVSIEISGSNNKANYVSISLNNSYLLDNKTKEYVEEYAKLNQAKLDINGINYTYTISAEVFNSKIEFDLKKLSAEEIREYLTNEPTADFDFLDIGKSEIELELDDFVCVLSK